MTQKSEVQREKKTRSKILYGYKNHVQEWSLPNYLQYNAKVQRLMPCLFEKYLHYFLALIEAKPHLRIVSLASLTHLTA
jgi:hypothetical protein